MSVVENWIIPMGVMALFIIVAGFLFVGLYFLIKPMIRNFKWKWKYKVRRKDYSERDVSWCVNAIEKRLSKASIKKHLLISNQKKGRINEMLFIYDQVLKQLQGGDDNDRQFRESYEEIKEIPKAE